MAVASDYRPSHRRTSSNLDPVDEEPNGDMSQPIPIPKSKSQPLLGTESKLSVKPLPGDATHGGAAIQGDSPPRDDSTSFLGTSPPSGYETPLLAPSSPGTPGRMSRTGSFSFSEDYDAFPPLDRLTVFDLLENLALPQRLEKLSNFTSKQTERVRRQQQRLNSSTKIAKDRVVEEWRRRVPSSEEQLGKYRKRMSNSIERLHRRWNDQRTISWREKISFIAAVMNIFVSGYLIGAFPQYFHWWYTAQLLYFMPIRWVSYYKRGYHYFLADLCYFVNLLCMLSIWVFPRSKRLLISTYCLANGNNAVAIAMWRNMLVFHSLDKVSTLFIHIMPPVALHCLVHLTTPEWQKERYPAIWMIKNSNPDDPWHYTVLGMMVWATVPYAVWQLSYHFFITIRKKEKIAAGRPTSFTWLRKSFAPYWIGKFVLSLPDALQEPAFMCIQYAYALATMLPCPIWFMSRWASGIFLSFWFTWSVYNGATYYIDVFGKRFQKDLEAMRAEVAKWQQSPRMGADGITPGWTPGTTPGLEMMPTSLGSPAMNVEDDAKDQANGDYLSHGGSQRRHDRNTSFDRIPMLNGNGEEKRDDANEGTPKASGVQFKFDEDSDGVRERKAQS